MAGDRDTLRRDQRLDVYARRHGQASGANIQDAGDGVPRYDHAGENEGDWVGHLVALAGIMRRLVSSHKWGLSRVAPVT